MVNELTIRVPLQPKQRELYRLMENSTAGYLGFGGSRGGAKSGGGRAVMLLRRLKYPGTRGAIMRRTWDLVRENHVEKYFDQYPFMRDWYHVQEKEIRLPNGSVIAFRYGETRKDIEAMIGKEYMDLVLDQAEMFSEGEIQTIKSCVRWPGLHRTMCKLVLAYNPGNIGHAFLKRVFHSKEYHGDEYEGDYAFIQAFGWDNIEWSRPALFEDGNGPDCPGGNCGKCQGCVYYGWDSDRRFEYFIKRSDYGRWLNSLPQSLKLGWLLGTMEKFAGQYYGEVWNPEFHVKHVQLEPWHPRTLGIDWGFGHPASAEWGAQPTEKLTVVYRELHRVGYGVRSLAQEIVDHNRGDKLERIWLSHDAFAHRDERETVAEQMTRVFLENGLPRPQPAGRDPVGSATLIYDLLRYGELVVDPSCSHLVETIPMITRHPDRAEETVKFDASANGEGGDDSFDALKHLLHGRLPAQAKPEELVLREQAKAMGDPLVRWFFLTEGLRKLERPVVIQQEHKMPWEVVQ